MNLAEFAFTRPSRLTPPCLFSAAYCRVIGKDISNIILFTILGVFTKEVAIKRKQSWETAWNLLYSIGVTLRSSSKLHKKAIFGALLFRQISQNLIHHKELRLCNLKPAKWRVSRHFHEIFRRNFEGWRQEIERLKQWSRPWNGILLKTNIIWPND